MYILKTPNGKAQYSGPNGGCAFCVRLAIGHRTDTADVALTSTSAVTAYSRPAYSSFGALFKGGPTHSHHEFKKKKPVLALHSGKYGTK